MKHTRWQLLVLMDIIFKNEKMKTTTLLATQAYITAGAVESVTKFLTGRTRPSYYPRVLKQNLNS